MKTNASLTTIDINRNRVLLTAEEKIREDKASANQVMEVKRGEGRGIQLKKIKSSRRSRGIPKKASSAAFSSARELGRLCYVMIGCFGAASFLTQANTGNPITLSTLKR